MKHLIYIYILLLSVKLVAQCYPDRHSTSWYDAWVSCEKSENPNAERGVSHWVQYDLGAIYSLKTSHFWNINDPLHLDYGVREMAVDLSLDGINWEPFGAFDLEISEGKPIYEGVSGPDFESTLARFVLITVLDNYGGNCSGFSEMKINVGDFISEIDPETGFEAIVYPNPFGEQITIKLYTLFPDENLTYTITDLLGKTLFTSTPQELQGENELIIEEEIKNLSTGIYLLSLYHHSQEPVTFKIVKR
jgi:hypothetical protein